MFGEFSDHYFILYSVFFLFIFQKFTSLINIGIFIMLCVFELYIPINENKQRVEAEW